MTGLAGRSGARSVGCVLALCGLLCAATLAAEPRPWVAPGDLPIPAAVRSAEVTREDEPVYQAPSSAAPRRGAVA
ncbi:MAG: hypothetical protein ABW061_29600, partial [Polyangiaceae bacterium]